MHGFSSRRAPARRARACGLAAVALAAACSTTLAANDDLARLSLEELSGVEVTSVSRTPEELRGAPAAIYVITQEEIVRSGASTLAEALRLAPNLRITQRTANNFVPSARGFGGHPDVQNFSNKILLLIDGRSVYSPLFSGIYLDVQDLMLQDIERIEVISGPGATLWGANAVNGVINVITRPAYLSDGALVVAGGGPREQHLSARVGGRTETVAWRAYAKGFDRDGSLLDNGSDAEDDWRKAQAGFRLDLTRSDGVVTLQGDVYQGDEERAGPGRQDISGANLLGRWRRQSARGEFQLQGYYDHSRRGAPVDGVPLALDTWDLEAQQSLSLSPSNRLVWGMGVRVHHYNIVNSASLIFNPPSRTLEQWNLFAQDTFSLGRRVNATVGFKVERNDYTGWEPQPDLRLSWQVNDRTMLWGAISRAVRSPTPLDADVEERVGSVVFLTGDPQFESENVLAYEVGYRGEPSTALSLSLSAFYNVYNDLRTVEPASATVFLPLRWGNLMQGHAYGMTAWAKWQVTDWWRLAPGFALLRKNLQFKAGASTLLGTGQAGNDPRGHGLLSSSMRLGAAGSLDLTLRHVGPLPDPALPAYTELSARLAWMLSDHWEVALTGSNLLHERHREYPAPAGNSIRRSVLAEARWRR